MNTIKKKFYAYIDYFALKADLKKRRDTCNGRVPRHGKNCLTKQEIEEIGNTWDKWGADYYCFSFYKHFCGKYDKNYVPDDFYDYAEHVLNLRWSAFFLQHKSLLKIIIPSQNRAKVLLRKIDGHFVDDNFTELTKGAAYRLLANCPEFVSKLARGTGGGRGVQLIRWKDIADKEQVLNDILTPPDMEYEYVIKQHDFMSNFNKDSINTFRVVSLNINGQCTVLSTFLRMGAPGAFVDNLSGGNGVLVGVDSKGTLHEFGIDKKFNKIYSSLMGIEFKGMQVPFFDRIKDTVISLHEKIPYANLIGWDIAIATDGTPIVIEINLDSALIEAHQIFNGPIFGDRLEEVKDYIKAREPLLKHQMIIY